MHSFQGTLGAECVLQLYVQVPMRVAATPWQGPGVVAAADIALEQAIRSTATTTLLRQLQDNVLAGLPASPPVSNNPVLRWEQGIAQWSSFLCTHGSHVHQVLRAS
jgi:hypothetical protein